MLNIMRKNTKIILWILLILIIPAFVFFGIGSAMKKGKNPVLGFVFGKKIRLSDFFNENRDMQVTRNLSGKKIENPYELEAMIWHRIVLLAEARRKGITVTKQEQANAIKNMFSIKGTFDQEYYKRIVEKNLGMTILNFEEILKNNIMIDKLTGLIAETVKIVPEEVKEFYTYENENLEIIYTVIAHTTFTETVEIKDNLLGDFFSSNQERYRVPEKRNCKYIKITMDSFINDVKASEQEIEAYFDEHTEEFKDENGTIKPLDQVRPAISDEIKKEKASQKQYTETETLFDQLLQNPNINKIASKNNLTVHTSGFLSSEEGLPGVEQSEIFTRNLFKVKLGEVSDPIKIDSTYYLLIPFEEEKSYLPPIEEVIEKLNIDFTDQKAYEKATLKAEEIIQKLHDKEILDRACFEETVHASNLTIISPQAFNRRDSELDFQDTYKIKREAFNLPENTISGVVPLSSGPAFLMVVKRKGIDEAKFEEEKEYYTKKYFLRKKEIVLSEWYRDLLKECRIITSLAYLDQKSKEEDSSESK